MPQERSIDMAEEKKKVEVKEKVYKKVKCYKCGYVYDDIYKRCPECNASNTLHYLGIFTIALVATYLVVAVTFTMIKTIKLENAIKALQFSANNYGYVDANTEIYDITQASYYESMKATDENFENMIKDVDSYILYFHQDGCEYCLHANTFINAYVQLGYTNEVPVIFVTPQYANSIFDKYAIESTPTAIYHANGEDKTYVGDEEIFNLFDGLVTKIEN